jgi:hypothetical protein
VVYSVDELELSERSRDEIKVRFTVAGDASTQRLRVEVIYDESVIDLSTPGGRNADQLDLTVEDGTTEARILARVRPGFSLEDAEQTEYPIHFVARAGSLRLDTRRAGIGPILATLPRPDVVALVVEQEGVTGPLPATRNGIELRPFPNRTTNFKLKMKNRSGKQKTVQAALYSVPVTAIELPPGRLLTEKGVPYDLLQRAVFRQGSGQPPSMSPLAESKPLVLPPDSDAVTIDFSPPPPAAEEPQPGQPPAPSPNPPAPDGAEPIPHGLVCVLSDGELQHVYWLELRPHTPRDYMDLRVNYNERDQIMVAGRLRANAPQLTRPIGLSWDISWLPRSLQLSGQATQDEITGEKPQAILSARLVVDQQQRRGVARVRIDADGWPRAFAYDIDLGRRGPVAAKRDAVSLRITDVSVADGERAYLTHGYQPVTPREPPAIAIQPNESAAFPPPIGQSKLLIGLQVDAPYDTFLRGHAGDYVELSLRSEDLPARPIRRLYNDRSVNFEFDKAAADGLLSINTNVGDYLGPYTLVQSIGGLKDRYELTATLYVNGEDRHTSNVILTFDDSRPSISNFRLSPRRVEAGREMMLSFTGEDMSGLASAEYAIIESREAKVEKFTPLSIPPTADPGQRITFRTTVSLADLKLAKPKDYWLRVRLTDKLGLARTQDLQFRVSPKPAPDDGGVAQAADYRGTVTGYVYTANSRPSRFKVNLIGGKRFPEYVTSSGGNFKFENVPLGKYEIKAAGILSGAFPKEGSIEIELETPGDYRPFPVPLQDPEPKP